MLCLYIISLLTTLNPLQFDDEWGVELAANIAKNTFHYVELFSRAIDELMPTETVQVPLIIMVDILHTPPNTKDGLELDGRDQCDFAAQRGQDQTARIGH